MSANIYNVLYCDACAVLHIEPPATISYETNIVTTPQTLAWLREKAKEQGWVYRHGYGPFADLIFDLCPQHIAPDPIR